MTSVDSPPSHRFNHRNFMSCTDMPVVFAHELVNLICMFKWQSFDLLICLFGSLACMLKVRVCTGDTHRKNYAVMDNILKIMFFFKSPFQFFPQMHSVL